jgi:hypothetical protein
MGFRVFSIGERATRLDDRRIGNEIIAKATIFLEGDQFNTFVQASASGAGGERIGRWVFKFHAAYRAAEPAPQRPPGPPPTNHLVAGPEEKDPREEDEQADKDHPLELNENHGGDGFPH